MRRISCPSRAIDPSAPLRSSVRPRISPCPSPCRVVVPPCTHLRTSTAAFSSTPARAFLLSGKPDKRKHQQFVRKWQKRLLGDSEPIGAHVDPYDPTSPVRIAPEEQGEYEEVLEEERRRTERAKRTTSKHKADTSPFQRYIPAEELGQERPGHRLRHIGGEEWLQQKQEGDMAKEFEKLTLQTYTPLTLEMASEIEDLTGTPYTLRDGNLMLAQTVHQETGRPYTRHNFGLQRKGKHAASVRDRFVQAVSEVYALKEAGRDMDLAKLPNRGIYDVPHWVKDVKLYKTESGDLALAYPEGKSAEHFLSAMQDLPEWDSAVALEEEEALAEEELLVEEADLLDPVLPQENVPTMDPATPAFKRAAVVKIDAEKKPFDFMSNRPVPRAKPAEIAVVEEVLEVEQPEIEATVPVSSRLTELMAAFETSQSAVNSLRHTVFEHRAQRIADEIAAVRAITSQKTTSPSMTTLVERVKWQHVPITDLAIKFALFKRLFQLTGYRISDPHLSSSNTLGDLYGHLCDAAKPQPTSLFSAVHIEGQQRATHRKSSQPTSKRRADVGDLITLGNVQLRKVKADKTERLSKTGMNKVIKYALWERGLGRGQSQTSTETTTGTRLPRLPKAREGTRAMPEFGRPLSRKTVGKLTEWTKEELKRDAAKAKLATKL